jgi:hypothetical protein
MPAVLSGVARRNKAASFKLRQARPELEKSKFTAEFLTTKNLGSALSRAVKVTAINVAKILL